MTHHKSSIFSFLSFEKPPGLLLSVRLEGLSEVEDCGVEGCCWMADEKPIQNVRVGGIDIRE